jgi:hypothetical protein
MINHKMIIFFINKGKKILLTRFNYNFDPHLFVNPILAEKQTSLKFNQCFPFYFKCEPPFPPFLSPLSPFLTCFFIIFSTPFYIFIHFFLKNNNKHIRYLQEFLCNDSWISTVIMSIRCTN